MPFRGRCQCNPQAPQRAPFPVPGYTGQCPSFRQSGPEFLAWLLQKLVVSVSTQLLKSACGKRPSTELQGEGVLPAEELSKQFLEGNIRPGCLKWVWSNGKNTKLQILRYGLALSRFTVLPKLICGTQTLDGRNLWTFMEKSFFFSFSSKILLF